MVCLYIHDNTLTQNSFFSFHRNVYVSPNACIEHGMQYNNQDIKELEFLNFVRHAFWLVAFKF